MKYNKSIKKSFLNLLMFNGNKKISEKILLKTLKNIQKKFNKKKSLDIVKIGLVNSSPVFFLKNIKRRKKRTVEFPFLLSSSLRTFYGINFIIANCKNKKQGRFFQKLEEELILSAQNTGLSIKRKKDLYAESVLKKKFANYRWF